MRFIFNKRNNFIFLLEISFLSLTLASLYQIFAQTLIRREPIKDSELIDVQPKKEISLIPQLISPAAGAVMDNSCLGKDKTFWDFRWNPVPGAKQYHIYVIGGEPTNAPSPGEIRYKPNPILNDSKAKYTIYWFTAPSGYILPGNYEGWRWKVRAKVDGKWQPWSEERTFNVEPWETDCDEKKENKRIL